MSPDRAPAAVLDASALLAYLQREPGYEQVAEALAGGAAMSTVNLAETYARAAASGQDAEALAARLSARGVVAMAFIEEDARVSAFLYLKTRDRGLSLGDRACLALGMRLGLPTLTADHSWTRLKVGPEVRVIR